MVKGVGIACVHAAGSFTARALSKPGDACATNERGMKVALSRANPKDSMC